MNRNPLISIIVPFYNAARYLWVLCESIQKQSFADFEVLMLDDGSTDSSFDVMNRFGGDPRFRVERMDQNRGAAACNAQLLRSARGEYWANPGADDLIDPNFLARRIAALEAHPSVSLIHGRARLIDQNGGPAPDEHGRFEPFLQIPPVAGGKRLLELLLMHNVINNPSVLVRMEPTRRILQKFEERWQYAYDWFLWLLLASLDTEFLYDNERLNSYRIHPESLTCAPAKAARRAIEIRLVPLAALSAGQENSAVAKCAWNRWRVPLYIRWLRRAAQLRIRNQLGDEWVQIAMKAFYGETYKPSNLANEIIKYAGSIAVASYRDRNARQRIKFPAAGLVEVSDPAFR